jgi:signal transduction histidine kinase
MAPSSADLEARWAAWRLERNRRGTRTLLWIVLVLYPLFGALDILVAPADARAWLLGTRAVVTAGTLAMFPFTRTRAFARHADACAAAYLLVCAGGISSMTVFMGGLSSPYYAGLTLAVVAAGLLFVWPRGIIVTTHALIVLTFVAANGLSGRVGRLFDATSNLMFLSATALIAGIGQVLAAHSLREQHDQRARLEDTTTRLESAHAELQQLAAFKSRFFANMTHELRTPLAMVLTPLELMLQGEMGAFSDAQRSAFGTMFRSALKLLKLINDLLDLSRLEESRLRLAVREHDLVAHLRGLTAETQVLAARKGLALRFAPAVERADVFCDLDRMERVFVNLISNAVKFTPPGGHVEVRVADAGDAVQVEVEDDGPGFPPDKAAELFERFYQVDMDGTRQHGGAGIGLALAKDLVALHGGTLAAASDGRRGARFTVALRKGSAHVAEDALAAGSATAVPEGEFGADFAVQLSAHRDFRLLEVDEASERRVVERDTDEGSRPYTALVVEDNPQVARLVHMALRRQFKVLVAADGLRGLELALRERPTLVVTDLMMPGIDGNELTRRLREDPRTRHTPILMLTARGDVDDRVRGLETGASAYLTKPFSPKELVSCARRLVRDNEQTADLVLTDRMESLEIVAAGLAHEMNNPLNYVKNALARVRRDAEAAVRLAAEARARPLDAAEQAQLERAAARVGELLATADAGLKRIGGTVALMTRYGRAGFRREVVAHDAWEAVRAVVGIVLPATGRKVDLDLDLRGDPTVECVPEEFNQVLTNLVQNAIEAVPDGGGRVRVAGDGDGDALVLSVKDNGPGIAPDVRERLFTPFFTTKGVGRGVGLGLTITRRVVQSMAGTIEVVSAPGEGAEFVVRVPRRRPPAVPVS